MFLHISKLCFYLPNSMGTDHLLLSYFKKNYIWGEIFVILGLANTSNCLMWMIKYMLKISSNQSPSTNLLIPNHSILGYFWNYGSFCSHEKKRYFSHTRKTSQSSVLPQTLESQWESIPVCTPVDPAPVIQKDNGS